MGLGFDPYGAQVPLRSAGVARAGYGEREQQWVDWNSYGDAGRRGLLGNDDGERERGGTWDTAAPVNLIAWAEHVVFCRKSAEGQWRIHGVERGGSQSYGTQLNGGGGTLPGGGKYAALVANSAMRSAADVDQFPGADLGCERGSSTSSVRHAAYASAALMSSRSK